MSTRIAALVLALASFTGCYATVEHQPAYAPSELIVTPAPVRIETYPYVYYDGAPVYWVEGRWYRRNGESWVYYRREPAYLGQRRPAPSGVVTAPPAYGPVPHAPPTRHPAPPATVVAPPAR